MPDTGQNVSSAQDFEALVADVYVPLQRYLRRRTDGDTAGDVLADTLLVMWRRFDDIPADARAQLRFEWLATVDDAVRVALESGTV